MHTHAGSRHRTGEADGVAFATMRLAVVAALAIGRGRIGLALPAAVAATEMPEFFRDPAIVEVLRGRGLIQEEVEKVCSGNWLRVLDAVRA